MSLPERWHELPLAVLDVETTGLDPKADRIIEIAVIHMCRGEVEGRWSTLVDPERALPEDAASITGISAADLAGAPRFGDVAAEVRKRLEGRALVAYNLPFDRAFVREELLRAGVAWEPERCIDPLVFVRELHRNQGSKRLGAAAKRLGISLDEAHRAAADAEVAGLVLYALAALLPAATEDLLLLVAQWAEQQDHEMAGWKGRKGVRIDEGPVGLGVADRGNALGPAYVYGEDTDHVRAMFAQLPDSGSRR